MRVEKERVERSASNGRESREELRVEEERVERSASKE